MYLRCCQFTKKDLELARNPSLKARPKPLPASVFKLLGKFHDVEVARRTGVASLTVRRARKARGIPAASVSKQIAPYFRLLGKQSDQSISELSHLPAWVVGDFRRAKGIAPMTPRLPNKPLPARLRKLLGTQPDTALARRFGLPVYRVTASRRELGIPAFSMRALLRPTHLAQLGKAPDSEIAARAGVGQDCVFHVRVELGIPAYAPRSVSQPEARAVARHRGLTAEAAAKELRVSRETVMLARHREIVQTTGQNRQWSLPDAALKELGTQTDRELAQQFGVSARTIYRARLARDIPKVSANRPP